MCLPRASRIHTTILSSSKQITCHDTYTHAYGGPKYARVLLRSCGSCSCRAAAIDQRNSNTGQNRGNQALHFLSIVPHHCVPHSFLSSLSSGARVRAATTQNGSAAAAAAAPSQPSGSAAAAATTPPHTKRARDETHRTRALTDREHVQGVTCAAALASTRLSLLVCVCRTPPPPCRALVVHHHHRRYSRCSRR